MSIRTRSIESATAEQLPVEIQTSGDPTGSNPEFAVTDLDSADADNPTNWVAGTWASTWDATNGKIDALSAMAGAGQALDVTAGNCYAGWVRWSVGGETPVREFVKLVVT